MKERTKRNEKRKGIESQKGKQHKERQHGSKE
jgi:hypothetical protein